MKIHSGWKLLLAGLGAGVITGLLGTGGGMVLIPLLPLCLDLKGADLFPLCVTIMFPICCVSLLVSGIPDSFDWSTALPYLLGSAAGGLLCPRIGRKIPVQWLHRVLGLLMIGGGLWTFF